MKSYLGTFLIATIVAAVLSPLVRQFALRIGAVSWPGGRHVHLRPIARMGGVAIFGAFFSAIAALLMLDNVLGQEFRRNWVQVLGLFGGATLMCGVGALDDRKPLPAKTKLAVQIVAACVAFACGFRIEYIQLPFFGDLSMGIFSLPITILWVVGIVNAVNLIDGLDGLAAGIVFCAGVTNFVVANVSGQLFISSVMAALVGSVFGFLFHNFNPARIFMGDSGSYLLGYVMATATLIGSQHKASTAVSLLVPCLALGVPIFDTLFSMVRRWLERKPIFSPDRGHIHHRLLDMGLTHRRVVLIIYGFTAAFCIAAIAVYLGRSWQIGAALLGASLVFFGMMRFAGYFNYLQQSLRGRTSPALRQTRLVQRALPVVCVNIHTSKDVRAVFAALATFAEEASFEKAQLVPLGSKEPLLQWERTPPMADEGSQQASASYLLGEEGYARAELRLEWTSSGLESEPQLEVLLQVLADATARQLTALNSELAPKQRESHVPAAPTVHAPLTAEPLTAGKSHA